MEASSKAEVARNKLLSNYIQQHLQRESKQTLPPTIRMAARIQAMDSTPSSSKRSPQKNLIAQESDFAEFRNKLDWDEMDDEEESSDEELRMESRNYADHFSTITSTHFDSLDLETQHEILFQMQESKKTNSWAKMGEMPREAGEFSSFQMDRLLKRRFLLKKIQSVQKEMGQRHIHVQNLDELATYEAEFGSEAEIVTGSKDKGALLLKPKLNTPGTSSDQSGRRVPNPSGAIHGVCPLDLSSRESSDEGRFCQTLSRQSTVKTSEEDVDIQTAIELSLIQEQKNQDSMDMETKDSTHLVMLEEDGELEKAIQLSLEADNSLKRRSSQTLSPPKSPRRREVHQRSPMKFSNQSSLSEKPFEQSIADDMSTACYKFLGWVGFNDKVIPSSPSKSSHPQTLVEVSSSSEDDFHNVGSDTDVDLEVVPEKSPASFPRGPSAVIGVSQTNLLPSSIEETLSSSEDEFEEVKGEVDLEPRIEDEKSLVSHLLSITTLPPPPTNSTPMQIRISQELDLTEDLFADVFRNRDLGEGELKINSPSLPDSSASPGHSVDTGGQKPSNGTVAELDDSPVKCYGEVLPENNSIGDENDKGGGHEGIERTLGTIPNQTTTSSSPVRIISMDYMQRQEKLVEEEVRLKGEMGDQERFSASISDQMYSEAQELLTLFGIPFVVSPMEAESQCAFLDAACMTDGSLTDDSDIWLFGGLRVYKNFFSQGDRHVQFFQYADIVRKLHLDREKLILVGMLSGSDYTNGIEGVGPVTALEIIGESGFQGGTTFETLDKFYAWWSSVQETRDVATPENKLREKWRKLKIRPGFPSQVVYDAYMNPTIDTSTESFHWGSPDLQSLRHYAQNKFGWNQARTDALLTPALKNFTCQEKELGRQTTLDSFVTRLDMGHSTGHSAGPSKRLQRAMKKLRRQRSEVAPPDEVALSSDSDAKEEETPPSTGKRKAKVGSQGSVKRKKGETSEGHHIPLGTASPIPQRMKRQEEREGNKRRAIQILKKEKESA